MRLEIVRTVFLKELRETLRDRRSLLVMFGVPLLLYPLMMMSLAGLGISTNRRMVQQASWVALVHAGAAPHLLTQMRQPDSGVRVTSPRDPKAALAAGQVDAVLILPPHCETDALASRETKIRLQIDRSRTAASFTERKLQRLLDRYEQWIIAERLRAHGVSTALLRPLRSVTDDIASSDRRLGSLLGRILPMMLLLTGMLGAFFPAINATTAERELGTLETLLVTPARKMELLLAKGALVLLSGLLTAALNMISMALVLWRTFSMTAHGPVAMAINPGALALSYLAAVPTIICFSAIVLIVGLFARNFREANAYSTPVMLVPMVPVFVSVAEPRATPGLLVTPTVNTTIVIRDVLAGHASASAFLLAFGSSCLYAGLLVSLAARLFTTEQLVAVGWEPLSMRGLRNAARKGAAKRGGRLPAVDEALALFAFSLLLMLYVSPEWLRWGFLPLLAGNEILLIAAPALLFAWIGRYNWRETFAWRRPGAAEMAGALLMGLGVLPWVYTLSALQEKVWPQNPEFVREMVHLILPAVQQHPVLTITAVGVLAGVCEETLFRGPIQAALARRLPPWVALATGGFLFAAAHMEPQGMLFRTLLGMLLGWIVLRGGSVLPAMLMHAVIDSTHLGVLAWAMHSWRPKGVPSDLEMVAHASAVITGSWPVELAAGTLLLLLGWNLCRRSYQRRMEDAKPSEPSRQLQETPAIS